MTAAFLYLPTQATEAATTPERVRFGMSAGTIDHQTNAGVKPDYGTFWIGPWTLKHGWGGPDGQLDRMKSLGVTPAIHFYYWGDDISPSCVENGCWSDLHNAHKNKADWQKLADQLVQHLHARMQGAPVIILVETEFNKGGIEKYEAFDGYLADKSNFIRNGYPAAKIVMPLGNWNSPAWVHFDRTAAASDYVGLQGMRGSTRDSMDRYTSLYEATLSGARTAKGYFGKPLFLHDIALSSYPSATYTQPQAAELKEFFTGLPDLKAAGVQAIIYRSWLDTPTMSLANYYGEAERHWGLSTSTTWKPSATVWVNGVKAERAAAAEPSPSPTSPPPPTAIEIGASGASLEVEAFAAKTSGRQYSDSAASGGAYWNLWANGHVAQPVEVAAGEYDVTVRARGTLHSGVGPRMTVRMGDVVVLSADPGTSYGDFTGRVSAGGPTELRIVFSNDAHSGGEDRNLLLDRVTFAPVTANRAPEASFTEQTANLGVDVDASGSSDPDGDALTFGWDFGDGATGAGVKANHTYAASGTYTIMLSASDGRQITTAMRSVTVTQPNRAPSASVAATTRDLTVTVDGSGSTDPEGDPLMFAWDFGDGATATQATASHAYKGAGTYTVTLTVSDGRASSKASQSVTVKVPAFTGTVKPTQNINTWWVEAVAETSSEPTKVEASVNGGAWKALTKRSWGAWAASFHVPAGSSVVFRATDAQGQTLTSPAYKWLENTLQATFVPRAQHNPWWVEVSVKADQPLAKVEARINGGAWTPLSATNWGTWAKSLHAPDGSVVVFRATSTSGATATSATYGWG